MTRECAVEFGGAGATRMCTSSEILNTATVVQGLVGEAWERPSWHPASYSTGPPCNAAAVTTRHFLRLRQASNLRVGGYGRAALAFHRELRSLTNPSRRAMFSLFRRGVEDPGRLEATARSDWVPRGCRLVPAAGLRVRTPCVIL